jgi:uncharacterized protein YbaR (Trm112 family)
MDKELLGIMACPKCKSGLRHQKGFLTCGKCGLAFPILDRTIPDMLIEDAWTLNKARKSGFEHKMGL